MLLQCVPEFVLELYAGICAGVVLKLCARMCACLCAVILMTSTIHSFRYYLKPMHLWSKVKICLFITTYCALMISGFIYTFNYFNSILRYLKENKFQNFLYILDGLYSGLTQTSIVTLITFISDLVRREINNIH
jgi:hypothetical protein